mgnify:FL=1
MDKGFFDLYFFKNIENSNDKVKEVLKKNDSSRLALFCINQKKGRGRKGRVWKSKIGDLTCSILIKKKLDISEMGRINIIIVSIIINIFEDLGLNKVKFKWPNDIFINKKKIAGILIETSVSNNIVTQFIIGIGVNIKSRPNDLKYSSTSLFENKLNIKAHSLFFNIIKRLYFFIENYKNIEFLYLSKKLSSRFFNKKSLINVYNGNNKNEGLFSEIGCLGELIIKNKNKNLTIKYGEII